MPGSNVSAKDIFFYAAPGTNGVWFGNSPKLFAGGRAKIAPSLAAVVDVARAAKRGLSPGSRTTLFLRGGTYELSEPLVLRPEDSGLTIAAYRNEKPVISGGRKVTGWRKVAGKPGLWETVIPSVRDGTWYFRSLYANGKRMPRTQRPRQGFFSVNGNAPKMHLDWLPYHPGDIEPEWALTGDVEVDALMTWTSFKFFIRAVDVTNHFVTLSRKPVFTEQVKNARYFIENVPNALSTPGEWYLDRKSGLLRCIASPGEDLRKIEVIAPQLDALVVLQGDLATPRPVENVTLRGLTFSHTDWTMPAEGYADLQAAIDVCGCVRAEGATGCTFEKCLFARLGGYAVELGRGCKRDQVNHCEMFDLGGGGVRIGETIVRPDAFEQNNSHVIADNHIYQGGRVYPAAVGVLILQSGTNVVSHNEIDHLFYTAISVGWNWGYQETPCRENIIEFNHLHDIGLGLLSDMGAVYTLGIQRGTIVRNNLIHDVETFSFGACGLYTDEGSSDILLENNIVYHCKSTGFHQNYGSNNIVRNNIFAFNREHQVIRTCDENHISFFFTNNIVVFDSGDMLGSNWHADEDRYVMDHNIYWDARPGAKPENLLFAGTTFKNWQLRGHDMHSLVCDPLFVAPERMDFRLKHGSPAWKVGFKAIGLSNVGLRQEGPGGAP